MLLNANDALASTLDIGTGLRRLCRTLVPGLADWCVIDLLDDQGQVDRRIVEHRDPGLLPAGLFEIRLPPVLDASPASLARVLRGTGPVVVDEFPGPEHATDPLHAAELELFTRLRADTAIMAPLRSRQQVLGALTLVRSGDTAPLTEKDLPLVRDLAHRVALAVDNARLYTEVQHIAERLQRSLLPELPNGGVPQIAARYQPAAEPAQVGGDWYDAFVLPGGVTALIIGDVAGHDLRAAVTMGQARNMLRGVACDRKEPPGKILARLDAALRIVSKGETLTCIYGLLEKPAPDEPWNLQYGVAGHPPPLLVAGDGDTRFLTEGRSMMLGVDPTRIRPDATEILPPRSTLVLYTDGLIERRGENLDRGLARLRQHAAGLAMEPLESFCDELLSGLAPTSADDVALIAVRVPAPGEGPAAATVD